ncbi:MAG: FxsA family protein [Planctomycetota bacterium]|nr:MAG: FxsA family protein [Planctomycetota bacterium]
MLGRILLLLILLPAIEIVFLVWVASKTSVLLVLLMLVGAGLLGAFLARQQGLRTMQRISNEVSAGRMPGDAMIDGVLVSLAAVLLILPGFLSDVVALLLLFPPSRSWLKSVARGRIRARIMTSYNGQVHTFDSAAGGRSSARDEIIDVKVIESPPREIGS